MSLFQALLVALAVLRFSTSALRQGSLDESESESSYSASLCPSHCTDVDTDADTDTTGGARIFYLIIVHNERTMHDALHLFRAIRDRRNTILIHVDQKAQHLLRNNSNDNNMTDSTSPLWREIESCPCASAVRVESVYNVQWSHWSMNLPTLWGLQMAVQEYAGTWDVFINLAGDNLPVYAAAQMAARLEQLPYNFVTSRSCETGLWPTDVYLFPAWWHKRAHYTVRDTEPDPVFTFTTRDGRQETKTVVTHFGSQWNILQASFCNWLVQELQRPDSLPSLYRDYLMQSGKLMTDETFLPTLIMHVDEFRETLPAVDNDTGELLWKNGAPSGITAVRYERMDEHMPTAFGEYTMQQRYQVPESSTELEEPRPWGPYFLGVYDLASIRDSGALFVRKVSEHVDPNLLHLLPVDRAEDIPPIQWPEEVSISPKPEWQETLRAVKAKVKQQQDERDATGSIHDEYVDETEL